MHVEWWAGLAVLGYLGLLLWIGQRTGKSNSMADFSVGGRRSPWWAVAFGMVGTSLSGVTFLSVPGWVGDQQFGYMQMVIGYLFGYAAIIGILLPLYYRLKLTSIYRFLGDRIGIKAYKTGAAFFLLSRSIGAAFRLYLVVLVLNETLLPATGTAGGWIRLTGLIVLVLGAIWAYTRQGGIATVVWTDTLQTACMLLAAFAAVWLIGQELGLSLIEVPDAIANSGHAQWWFFEDWGAPNHGVKQLVAGAFIALCMTGLDQDMMQKNLSCRNLKEAQTNMASFSVVLVFVNLMFLGLGALLLMHVDATGMEAGKPDLLFARIALDGGLGVALPILFLLGLVAAALSSADSALTALTTSVCVDFMGVDTEGQGTAEGKAQRQRIHLVVSIGIGLLILLFHAVNDTSVIAALFQNRELHLRPAARAFCLCLVPPWAPPQTRPLDSRGWPSCARTGRMGFGADRGHPRVQFRVRFAASEWIPDMVRCMVGGPDWAKPLRLCVIL